jgi:hypothetical protein
LLVSMIADEIGLIQVAQRLRRFLRPQSNGRPGCPERPPNSRLVSSPSPLHELHVLERQAAHRLAGGGEDRVHHRRRHHADRRLADAAPEVVAWHREATRQVAGQRS